MLAFYAVTLLSLLVLSSPNSARAAPKGIRARTRLGSRISKPAVPSYSYPKVPVVVPILIPSFQGDTVPKPDRNAADSSEEINSRFSKHHGHLSVNALWKEIVISDSMKDRSKFRPSQFSSTERPSDNYRKTSEPMNPITVLAISLAAGFAAVGIVMGILVGILRCREQRKTRRLKNLHGALHDKKNIDSAAHLIRDTRSEEKDARHRQLGKIILTGFT